MGRTLSRKTPGIPNNKRPADTGNPAAVSPGSLPAGIHGPLQRFTDAPQIGMNVPARERRIEWHVRCALSLIDDISAD